MSTYKKTGSDGLTGKFHQIFKEKVIQILKEQMQGAVNFSVQLTVNVASGKNWYEAK